MYHKHHTKGLVLSGRTEGDSDKRINIFTESFGLLNAKVQGGRNLHSKLRGGIQDFSFGEFSLVSGKTGWRVVSVRAEKNFFEIFHQTPEKLKIAGNILSLIKKLAGEENNPTLFPIIFNFFNFLEKVNPISDAGATKSLGQEQDIALAECLTLMRILHSLGYMRHDPELLIPMSSAEISIEDLVTIAPKRAKIITLINESLKAT